MAQEQAEPTTTKAPPTLDLRHASPPFTIYAGDRAVGALARELDRAGADSVTIVTSPSLSGAPLDQLTSQLGNRIISTFTTVERFSPTRVVEELKDHLLREKADAIVVLGGGSSMVTARAAAVLAGENRPADELYTFRDAEGRTTNPRKPAPKVPIWIIPSTPTPAASKAGAALRDERANRRVAIFDPKVRAKGIVIDPEIVRSSPSSLFVATALNGLSMGVEGLLATSSDPFAEALLRQGVHEIIVNHHSVLQHPDAWEARARMVMGSALTGLGSDYSGQGLALALSHEIAPRSSVAGGVVEMILLPGTVRFMAEAVPERTAALAGALDAEGTSIADIDRVLRRLPATLGLPARLRNIGISQSDLREAVEHAVSDWAMNARMPRRAGLDDLNSLVSEAW